MVLYFAFWAGIIIGIVVEVIVTYDGLRGVKR